MVLVVGATGELGMLVVRVLRGLGVEVRALVRPGSDYFRLNDTGCTYFFGDLKDITCLRRACRGVTQVISCAGIRVEDRRDNHQSVTVDGHKNLWLAATESGVQRVVYVSALGVDRGYPIPWFDAKLKAENALRQSGLPHVVIRPAPFTSNFMRWARNAEGRSITFMPGRGRNRLSPIGASEPRSTLFPVWMLPLKMDAL